MNPLNGYGKATTYSTSEQLPVGGYVLKIMDVDYQTYRWGDVIVLSFDIAEGDYKGFFQRTYNANTREDKKWKGKYRLRVPKDDGSEEDDRTMRRFKTIITAFEESNKGFHWDWDENKLKGKLIGGIFNQKEYEFEDRHGFYTNCYGLDTVDKIRKGKFKVPADTLLPKKQEDDSVSEFPDPDKDFMSIPEGSEDDGIPFN